VDVAGVVVASTKFRCAGKSGRKGRAGKSETQVFLSARPVTMFQIV
jgi:hypothetical protein